MNEEEDVQEVEQEEQAPEVVEEPPKAEEPEFDPELVEEARMFGWKPSTEWQGEIPQGYIDDPNEWLGRVKRSSIFKAMQTKLEATEESAKEQARKIEAVSKAAVERQKQEYDREIARLSQQARQAAEIGDLDAFDAAEKQRAELQRPVEASEPEAPGKPPEVAAWEQNNPWYGQDYYATARAQEIAQKAHSAGADVAGQLKAVDTYLAKEFPHLYAQPERAKPRAVVDGGGLAPSKAKDAFSKLPEDAKATFKAQVEMGLFKDTKEDRAFYAEEYNAA